MCTKGGEENFNKTDKLLWNIIDECSKACSTLQYRGENKVKGHGSSNNSRIIDLGYWFNNENEVKVFQEYLLYEITAVIGSIGGTLGLFIGFSFLDLSTRLINVLKDNFINVNAWWYNLQLELIANC